MYFLRWRGNALSQPSTIIVDGAELSVVVDKGSRRKTLLLKLTKLSLNTAFPWIPAITKDECQRDMDG